MGNLILQPGQRVLFQGDSITDSGRDREAFASLGSGYANFIAAWLSAKRPDLKLEFLNRGISGHRICDLEARWDEDCVDLKPDWLSILIGINDTWRRFDSNSVSDIPEFEACYRRILDKAQPARLIILEPFLLHVREGQSDWREDLDPRIQAVRRVACDYNAIYVPLDGLFAAACAQREPAFWAEDGVHPTNAGHALIAQAWLDAMS